MNQNSLHRLLTVLCLTVTLAACAGQPPVDREVQLSRSDLLSGMALGLGAGDYISATDTLAVNDDMRDFLARRIPAGAADQQKVELILGAILEDGLHLNYNNFKTLTAEEAFYQREGNCLSFTNLFVALAREAGVKADFQEVQVPPNWTMRGDTYMYNLHLNVLVNLPGNEQVIDFDMSSYDNEYNRRLISDDAALAQYHNNMGVHWLSEGEIETAFQHMRVALELRPHTGYFWTNLGTVYRRGGHLPEAEAAYLTAIDQGLEPTAMSNLARLYSQIGQPELADYYRSRVEIYRGKNPYYLFHLAEEAYAQAEYSRAESLLRKAIHYREDEQEFYRLLGLSHLQQGDKAAAERRFRQAAELAKDPVERQRINHKLHLLAGN